MRIRTAAILAAALATCGLGAAQAQEVTLKIHHFLPPPSTIHSKVLLPWCEKLAKDSNNRIKCQIFPAMQLGGTPPQLFDQAKDGVADIVWTLPGYTAGRFPAAETFELPFMTRTAEGSSRAVWEFMQQNNLLATEFKDVKVLGSHVHDPGVIHMREAQIKTLADFRGKKVRAPTRLTNKMIAAFGATPVGMPVPQVPEALSKGVIDGCVVPWEVVPAIKVQELVKYHSETDKASQALYATVFIFAMNKAKYDSLPADLRKVLDDNSGVYLSTLAGRAFDQSGVGARKLAQARGNVFYTIPMSELAAWHKIADGVAADWVKEVTAKGYNGEALRKSAKELIQKYDSK